jgi:hypothetical protein
MSAGLKSDVFAKVNALIHRSVSDLDHYRSKLHVANPTEAGVLLDDMIAFTKSLNDQLTELRRDNAR